MSQNDKPKAKSKTSSPTVTMDAANMLTSLERISRRSSSPTTEITALMLRAYSVKAPAFDKRRYIAMRNHFERTAVEAPDGYIYKLKTLQREYLRYRLVEEYKQAGNTWESCYELASEFLSETTPIVAATVRDSHARMKAILKEEGMPAFCRGLDYEYPVAMAGNKMPAPGTYLDPEYFKEQEHS